MIITVECFHKLLEWLQTRAVLTSLELTLMSFRLYRRD